MAKMNRFIATYSDNIHELGLSFDENTAPPKDVIRRFVRLFKDIDDVRCQAMIDYPLVEIILIAFLAVLANALAGILKVISVYFSTASMKMLSQRLCSL